MARDDVRDVIDVWARESDELGRTYRWVQVFENRGPGMGASNPHPHGQIWAGSALPEVAAREDASQRHHFATTGRSLLGDYLDQEAGGPRVVHDAGDWLVVVPFWAAWPFETLVLPKRPARRLGDLDGPARDALAGGLIALFAAYDGLFERPFPYSMGWHGAPHGGEASEHWLLHAHVYSDALRASVRKFMVGYELLAEVQRDLTPEDAAARLRAVPIG
jgi:UDPglucose--hexose-1-phosphate uridylyltransferase